MAERLVTIRKYSHLFEAEVAKAFLIEQGIQAMIGDENFAALNYAGFSPAKLIVPESAALRALALLDEAVNSRAFALDDTGDDSLADAWNDNEPSEDEDSERAS